MKTTKRIGDDGESRASHFLQTHGFEIIDRNWKTRYCEIDIIAKQNEVVYFVEVKTRKTDTYGTGLDYITPKKLEQMRFAAEMWVQANKWQGDYQLAAIGITGDDISFIDSI